MNFLLAWLRSKSITAHAVALAALTLASVVAADPQLQQWLKQVCGPHVGLATELIGFCVIVAKYSHSSSAAGKVAAADVIMAGQNPPTAEAIAAARTKPVTK